MCVLCEHTYICTVYLVTIYSVLHNVCTVYICGWLSDRLPHQEEGMDACTGMCPFVFIPRTLLDMRTMNLWSGLFTS